ncbi:hypothetical protein V8F20_004948 [Naviculisporaceae sp. PSN 640]
MDLDPLLGAERPINCDDFVPQSDQAPPEEQCIQHSGGLSPALFLADLHNSHRPSLNALLTGPSITQGHSDANSNIPVFATGNSALGWHNPFDNPYHNPFQNLLSSSAWPFLPDSSSTWPVDLDVTRRYPTLSQHNPAFQVGTALPLFHFPNQSQCHTTEFVTPLSVSPTSEVRPLISASQSQVPSELETESQRGFTYTSFSSNRRTRAPPSAPRPILPKPRSKCDIPTPFKKKIEVALPAEPLSLPKFVRPGRRWMEREVHRARGLKRKRSSSPYTKRVRVPEEHYYNCFQDGVRPLPQRENEATKRTRSAKVCFRCQDQKLKCDGDFPCQKCRDVARRGRIKYELPCIESDLHALNPFFDLLEHRWEGADSVAEMNRLMHALPFDPSIMIQDDSVPAHDISVWIAQAASELPAVMYPIPPTVARRVISNLSHFTSTGLPASVGNFLPPHISRGSKSSYDDNSRKIQRRTIPEDGFFQNNAELEAIFTLLTITFDGETLLGGWLSLPPHEIHALRFYWVAKALGLSANALKKWKADPKAVTADQKVRLGMMLISLLIVTEYRETYVVESLRRKFEGHCVGSSETAGGHLTSIIGYICRGMTTMKHLRQCVRHFLRRLFGGGTVPHEFWEAAVSIGLSSGHDLPLPVSRSKVYDHMDGWRVRQGLLKRLDTYLRNSMPTPVPPEYGITRDEFEQRVDYLGCKDVPTWSSSVHEGGLQECLVASKGLLPRHLNADQLRDFVEGMVKKRNSTFKRAASDEFEISGDKTSDTILKYLFLKWLEG